MSDPAKTSVFAVVAVVLCGAAYLSRPTPPPLEYFSDQGEPFYPDFTDPLEAASLEVIDFDEESGTAKPFKVEVRDGVWSIPSHYHYPADGEDRLAKTAAGVIDLKKDFVQSHRAQDHEALGVIDPLDDATPSLKGRGQRVTLRNNAGTVLADFIFGKPVEGKQGHRYVRLPGKKRTYGVKADMDISTRFADWIETNLLKLTSFDAASIEINDYSVDEATGTVDLVDKIHLAKGDDNKWTMPGLPAAQELDQSKVNRMVTSLAGITITGVRRKPASLTRGLRMNEGLKMDLATQLSLQSKGFFISRDGALLSNEGEVRVGTKDGVRYTLRFGEVIFGEGMEVSAGTETESAPDKDDNGEGDEEPQTGTENRYLFVTAAFDESLIGPRPVAPEGYRPASQGDDAPAAPEDDAQPEKAPPAETDDDAPTSEPASAETPTPTTQPSGETAAEDEQQAQADAEAENYERALKEWEEKAEAGRKLVDELNERFAPWYYVISGADFKTIRPKREQLIKAEPEKE